MAVPSFDISKTGTLGANGTTVTTAAMTTTKTNALIVVGVFSGVASGTQPDVNSVTGGGLTFTKRTSDKGSNLAGLELWTALSPGVLTAQTFTATFSATVPGAVIGAAAFGNINQSAPFDTNASLPKKQSSTGTSGWTPSFTGISTDMNNDVLLFMGGQGSSGSTFGAPTGFTQTFLSSVFAGWGTPNLVLYHRIVSSQQVNATIAASSVSTGGAAARLEAIFDAITGDAASASGPNAFAAIMA